MNEEAGLPSWKHKVGLAGQTTSVKTVSETGRVNEPADYQFRRGILGTDACHVKASLLRSETVHQTTVLWQ